MSVPVQLFRNETAAMAAHSNRLEENVIENNGVDKLAPCIRVRGESKSLHLCDKGFRDTRKEAGSITLETKVIHAKMRVGDKRKQSR